VHFDEIFFEGTIPVFRDNEPMLHEVIRGS